MYSSQRQTPPSGFGYLQSCRFAQFLHNPIQAPKSLSASINPVLEGMHPSTEILSGDRSSPVNSSHCQTGLAESRGKVHSEAFWQVRQRPWNDRFSDIFFSSSILLGGAPFGNRSYCPTDPFFVQRIYSSIKAKNVPTLWLLRKAEGRGVHPSKPPIFSA